MDIERSILIAADPADVFALVDDPARYPEFFVGITQWESRSRKKRGVGARYRVLMQVGSIQAGGTIEVVERRENELIEWIAVQGIRQHGRWELEPMEEGTFLRLHVGFDLSGGPLGKLVERMTGRIVGRNLWATLLAARRLLEVERPRARRAGTAARAGS